MALTVNVSFTNENTRGKILMLQTTHLIVVPVYSKVGNLYINLFTAFAVNKPEE